MKKMERREYLQRMAIAAGGVGLGRLNPFSKGGIANRMLENIRLDRTSLLTSPEVCPNSWPCTSVRPEANPGIRLVFAGMVAFTYKNTDKGTEGRVVFHRGSDDHHKMKVIVYRGSFPNCTKIYSNEEIPKKAIFDIRVEDTPSDANFFMSTTPFSRGELKGDDRDFRWLLDLETSPFANGKPRTEKKFSTKLRVGTGTFYTYKHTGSTFYYVNSHRDPVRLGYVPKVMAADIRLENNECLSFKIGSKDVLDNPICRGQKYEYSS